MKKLNGWDAYFYSRYKPIDTEWGKKDLSYHRNWYSSWIRYIETKYKEGFYKKNILEIGCGIGAISSLLQDKGALMTATDVSKQMLQIATRISPAIKFSYLDIRKKILKGNVYDGVVGFEVIEHLDDLEHAGENIYHVLKKGGFFIGTTPYPYSKNMTDVTHVNVHLPEFWKQYFLSLGFSHVSLYPLSCLPYIWRLHSSLNYILPFFTRFPYIVSTCLIVAKK